MPWHSPSEFFAMGGYGLYVWLSFGITAACMVWELVSVKQRHAAALKQSALSGGGQKP